MYRKSKWYIFLALFAFFCSSCGTSEVSDSSSALDSTSAVELQESSSSQTESSESDASESTNDFKDLIPFNEMERAPLIPNDPNEFIYYRRSNPDTDIYVPYETDAVSEIDKDFINKCLARYEYFWHASDNIDGIFRWADCAVIYNHALPILYESLCTTIFKNVSEINHVYFYRDGFVEGMQHRDMGNEEPLQMPEHTPEELTEVRQTLPHQMPESLQYWVSESSQSGGYLLDDPVVGLIERYLNALITFGNIPQEDFNAINDQSAVEFTLNSAAYNTISYTWGDEPDQISSLKPLSQTTSPWGQFGKLREHVEKTAYILFGEQYSFRPEGYRNKAYYESYGGVFVPIQMDYYSGDIPVVIEYEIKNSFYEATVAFVSYVDIDGADSYSDEEGNKIEESKLEQFLKESAKKHEMVFEIGEEGRIYLQSHHIVA